MGNRLNRDALGFQFAGQNIAQSSSLKIATLIEFLQQQPAEGSGAGISRRLIPQAVQRLRYLCQVGLSYLSLDRSINSLSSGEAQRVALTTSLGSTLVNMLYVLDEPSSGLHRHDMGPLCTAISGLHQRGNTVVVVDHEDPMIRAAERVVEIGPGAGDSGGEIVFDGTPAQLLAADASLTGEYLAGRRGISVGQSRRQPRGRLKLLGARGHNLQSINVDFPLGCLCVVTGVSGAGKSSLVQQTLYGAICNQKQKSCDPPLPYQDIFGDSQIEEVVLIDQSPIGRSPRSNPVTYVKAFDDIRKTFAETPDAKTHNLKTGHFSFNLAGGRCSKCEGDGCLTVDMQFLNDVVMTCDQCHGSRFGDQVLAVKYRGRNIAEVLEMTVREAFGFFRGQPRVQAKLKALIDVGLDYIRLGQPANKLSSGEAQRLKLALYLNANRRGRSLFIIDEPTNGLHMHDVVRLLDCFNALLDVGHSMIVVEHNLQLIKHADWIIDLGPGAADSGGRVVATGTPEQVAENDDSLTGRYLKPLLEMAIDE
jgi:excinuclease ABC subunit A